MTATNAHTEGALFLGGYPDPALAARIAAGQHPRVEYLELLRRHALRLVSFEEVEACASPLTRAARRRGGLCWGLAALGRLQRGLFLALTTGDDVGFPLALLHRLTGGSLPIYILTHGSYFGSRKGQIALRLLRGASSVHFLCLSETLRQRLIDAHQVPARRVHNIGYGVDTRFFQPQPAAAVFPRQVASAGMAKRDYKTLAAAVTGMDVDVKIAADSAWFRSDLDIADQALPPNVEARSYGDYVGLRRLYAESACVVVPMYEAVHACGYAVIAEAMAMGKPVITTRISGHSDYIVEGETGFYVPVGDAEALRSRILELVENPMLAARMGQNARCLMEENYSLEAYVRRVAAAMGLDEEL